MWHRHITNKCLVLPQKLWGVVSSRGDRKSLYIPWFIQASLCWCAAVQNISCGQTRVDSQGGVHTPPYHIPLCQVRNTHVFWSSFKGRKKPTRWQELGNAHFVCTSCCFGWHFLSRRTGSAWSVPAKMFLSVRHATGNCFYNRKYVWEFFSLCEVWAEGMKYSPLPKLVKVAGGVRSPCFLSWG